MGQENFKICIKTWAKTQSQIPSKNPCGYCFFMKPSLHLSCYSNSSLKDDRLALAEVRPSRLHGQSGIFENLVSIVALWQYRSIIIVINKNNDNTKSRRTCYYAVPALYLQMWNVIRFDRREMWLGLIAFLSQPGHDSWNYTHTR
jgi:hypothetical protein